MLWRIKGLVKHGEHIYCKLDYYRHIGKDSPSNLSVLCIIVNIFETCVGVKKYFIFKKYIEYNRKAYCWFDMPGCRGNLYFKVDFTHTQQLKEEKKKIYLLLYFFGKV